MTARQNLGNWRGTPALRWDGGARRHVAIPSEQESDFDRLLRTMRDPRTDGPGPVRLSCIMQDGKILEHRYLPCRAAFPANWTDAQVREAIAEAAATTPWTPGPPSALRDEESAP